MDPRTITVAKRPLDSVIQAASSKSVTHRALVAAALAKGPSRVVRPLVADDTCITRDALSALGLDVRVEPDGWVVEGCRGRIPGGGALELGESGTSLRLLMGLAALGEKPSRLDGAQRLRERPVQELSGALERLGAAIELTPGPGGLPLVAGGCPLHGGAIRVPSGRSSQFASALLMLGPCLPGGIELTLDPPVVSLPYVELTTRVMDAFGVQVERPGPLSFRVPEGCYQGRQYRVEGDHSSVSYFLAAAAIAGGTVRVEGIDPDSAQPDARLSRILREIGCRVENGPDWIEASGTGELGGMDLDMGEAPDLVPTLAVLALFADGESRLTNIAHLRHKESDRLEMLARNLRALGRAAEALDDRLIVRAREGSPHGARIETASDHRIAMAFAIAGLRIAGIELDDEGCVKKSNPDFWKQFGTLW